MSFDGEIYLNASVVGGACGFLLGPAAGFDARVKSLAMCAGSRSFPSRSAPIGSKVRHARLDHLHVTRLHACPVVLLALVAAAARLPSSRPSASAVTTRTQAASLDSSCLSGDTAATNFLHWTRRTASGADSTRIAMRASVGLPLTPADDVQLVSDDSVCLRAAFAVDSSAHVAPSSAGHVQVGKIGSRYFAVHRVGWAAGEWEKSFSLTAPSPLRAPPARLNEFGLHGAEEGDRPA